MSDGDWFVMRPQKAVAYGLPKDGGFLVKKNSTAMRDGSPKVKRDRHLRDRLIDRGVLVQDADRELLRFRSDYPFNSSSQAGGVIKDGNCSGPGSWRRERDGKTLKEVGPG